MHAPLYHRLGDWYKRGIAQTLRNAYVDWGGRSFEARAGEDRLQAQIYASILEPVPIQAATIKWESRFRRWASMQRRMVPLRKLIARAKLACKS